MLTKEQEKSLQSLKAEYDSGMLPYDNYIEMKREIMGDDYKEEPEEEIKHGEPKPAPAVSTAPVQSIPVIQPGLPEKPKYHVKADNKELGVFERETLFEMVRNGDIDIDFMVWRKDMMDDWMKAGDVPELENHFPDAPPPGSKADKRRKAIEDAKRKEEERKQVEIEREKQRKIDEKRKEEERVKTEEENKRRREREQVIAEENRKAEDRRKAEEKRREEQRKADEAELRKIENQRKADEAEIARIENQRKANEAASRRQTAQVRRGYRAAAVKGVFQVIFAILFALVFALTAGSLVLSLVTYLFTPGLIAIIITFLVAAGLVFLFIFRLFMNRPILTIILFTILLVVGVINNNVVENIYHHIISKLSSLRSISIGDFLSSQTTGTVTGVSSLNLREGPSTNHNIIKSIPEGGTVIITGEAENGWWPVKYKNDDGSFLEGYVGANYIKVNE